MKKQHEVVYTRGRNLLHSWDCSLFRPPSPHPVYWPVPGSVLMCSLALLWAGYWVPGLELGWTGRQGTPYLLNFFHVFWRYSQYDYWGINLGVLSATHGLQSLGAVSLTYPFWSLTFLAFIICLSDNLSFWTILAVVTFCLNSASRMG